MVARRRVMSIDCNSFGDHHRCGLVVGKTLLQCFGEFFGRILSTC